MNTGKKGLVLPLAVGLMAFCALFGLSAIQLADTQGQSHIRETSSNQAFWVGDAGLQKAYALGACSTGTGLAATSFGPGSYAVAVTTNSCVVTLTATGAVNGFSRNLRADCLVTSPFKFLAFSNGTITLSNNVFVDSYDSTKGNYGGSNVGNNGDIGTNGATIAIGNNVTVHGTQTTNAGAALAPVVVPAVLTALPAGVALTLTNNNTLTLPAGNYRYSKVNFANNVGLVISGDVLMYITGNPSFSGGNNAAVTVNAGASLTIYADGVVSFSNNVALNNLAKAPDKFVIYSTYTGANGVSINNNGTFYGVIYAPLTDVTMSNNTTVFGAMVGKTITLSNDNVVHYDESLGAFSDPNSPFTVKLGNWQEI